LTAKDGEEDSYTALVEVEGVIATDEDANADKIISGLRAAFEDEKAKGVIIRINSPGGSPVQAGYINDEIKRLREKHKKPIYAVATDLCASGGYYIAVAADKIYADKASVIGSIGVLMSSFGFVEGIKKLGVERRLYTAGEHKGFLDPFSPQQPEDVKHIQEVLENIHEQFIQKVKEGRGERLKTGNDTVLFSGLIWTGAQAKELGLVDELGTSSQIARDVFKAETIKNFTPKPDYFEQWIERLGVTLAKTVSWNKTVIQ
jgi:protease-4